MNKISGTLLIGFIIFFLFMLQMLYNISDLYLANLNGIVNGTKSLSFSFTVAFYCALISVTLGYLVTLFSFFIKEKWEDFVVRQMLGLTRNNKGIKTQ